MSSGPDMLGEPGPDTQVPSVPLLVRALCYRKLRDRDLLRQDLRGGGIGFHEVVEVLGRRYKVQIIVTEDHGG